jgi:outer membrane cobalamin receptor
LRNIPASNVAEIRFIEGWDAMTKYGSDHVAGVIQIYTRYQ